MSEKTKIETSKKIKNKSKYLDKASQTIRGGKVKIDIEDLICDGKLFTL